MPFLSVGVFAEISSEVEVVCDAWIKASRDRRIRSVSLYCSLVIKSGFVAIHALYPHPQLPSPFFV
jgi:hypothetical protein